MAFRTAFLEAVGGFDPRFRTAGDDVDVCWRLQDRGWTLGFHPAAVVWHHRRNSVRTYWRQQIGYGRAEAMLERKWPEKYNDVGHVRWTGRMYGSGLPYILLARRALTAALHLIQPIARLRGRILEGLTPWRRRCRRRPGPLWPVTVAVWSEHWLDQDQRLRAMETDLRTDGVCALRGGRDGRWDLEVRGGSFGAARLLMGVEEHAGGKRSEERRVGKECRSRWSPDH